MADDTDTLGLLRKLEGELAEAFSANRRVMAFDDYFGALSASPAQALRSVSQYVFDCVAHFGQVVVETPAGPVNHLQLFDAEFDQRSGRLIGQQAAQAEFQRVLNNFLGERRVTRLVLLHGPNGSAKSSFIRCLSRAMQAYSQTDMGAQYTFNWVFPKAAVAKKRLGFGSEAAPGARGPLTSYASLGEEDVNAVVPSDLRDHPLLLLPIEQRRKAIETLVETGVLARDFPVSDYLWNGDLSPRSRAIFDALLASYHGDVQRVLQHVQVERFFYSQRYRHGLVTVEPQLHVDATIRQVTMDQGLQSLPPALRHLNLFEPQGDLVDANRGILEFNDLLKKPVDAYKYLLATCEKGTVTLPNAILHLDVLFLASSNDIHLDAFKQYADFPSFKGRMDLIKMPYLRDFNVEREIYDLALEEHGGDLDVDPHATKILALWAVLTRLRKPDKALYPDGIADVIGSLTPIQKARLYAGDALPKELTADQRKLLQACVPQLLAEGQNSDRYEGGTGASPRALKQVLLNALQSGPGHGLSALALFDELRALVTMKTVYDFLQVEAKGGYQDHAAFIDQVFERYLERLNSDVRVAMGLVTQGRYVELFSRYILHVSYVLKGERIYNEKTGQTEEPDARLIAELESTWGVSDADGHRRDLVARVGAWRVDHPGEAMNYRKLFPELFSALESDYFHKQRDTVRTMSQHVLQVLSNERADEVALATLEEFGGVAAETESAGLDAQAQRRRTPLDADQVAAAEATIAHLVDELGYPRRGLQGPIGALLKHRYA